VTGNRADSKRNVSLNLCVTFLTVAHLTVRFAPGIGGSGLLLAAVTPGLEAKLGERTS
jgi:hypothetical protein